MTVSKNNKYLIERDINNVKYSFVDINNAASDVGLSIDNLPYSMRVLFENVVRGGASQEKLKAFQNWLLLKKSKKLLIAICF